MRPLQRRGDSLRKAALDAATTEEGKGLPTEGGIRRAVPASPAEAGEKCRKFQVLFQGFGCQTAGLSFAGLRNSSRFRGSHSDAIEWVDYRDGGGIRCGLRKAALDAATTEEGYFRRFGGFLHVVPGLGGIRGRRYGGRRHRCRHYRGRGKAYGRRH